MGIIPQIGVLVMLEAFKFDVVISGVHQIWTFSVLSTGVVISDSSGEPIKYIQAELHGNEMVTSYQDPSWVENGQNFAVQFIAQRCHGPRDFVRASWEDLDGECWSQPLLTAAAFEERLQEWSEWIEEDVVPF